MAGNVTFEATEADYVTANLLWTSRASQTRMLGWLVVAGAALAVIGIALDIWLGRTVLAAIKDIVWVLLFLAILIGIRFATPMMIRRQVKKMMAQNHALKEPVKCWWDEQAINFSGSSGTGNLAWGRLHRWLDNDATFVFLQSDRLMFVLPKRTLTKSQADDLYATLVAAGVRRF